MRGPDEQTHHMFSYLSPEQRVRADHPLRAIRAMTDRVFAELSPRFTKMYSDIGRPSIPPEQLLRALLLQSLYTVRSERLLMEEIDYSVLYRWFVGLSMDDPIWSPTTFSKNRDRLLESDIASVFFDAVIRQAQEAGLLSDEHFTVDGTLIEAWASQKSFQKKEDDGPGGDGADFHGHQRSNQTHASTTDPEAKLYRKGSGQEAKLSYLGHVLMENRNGLIVDAMVTEADGTAERDAAMLMVYARWRKRRPISSLGADKGYDTREFVQAMREMDVRPHVTQNVNRPGGSAIDARTARHAAYAIS